mmetsp:Transcript_1147/g.4838  ORF Transcript_1147/g.4838 Transcript_1147/m.4838 type:complete len:317 (-) Transcript_1147:4104-5054(-)
MRPSPRRVRLRRRRLGHDGPVPELETGVREVRQRAQRRRRHLFRWRRRAALGLGTGGPRRARKRAGDGVVVRVRLGAPRARQPPHRNLRGSNREHHAFGPRAHRRNARGQRLLVIRTSRRGSGSRGGRGRGRRAAGVCGGVRGLRVVASPSSGRFSLGRLFARASRPERVAPHARACGATRSGREARAKRRPREKRPEEGDATTRRPRTPPQTPAARRPRPRPPRLPLPRLDVRITRSLCPRAFRRCARGPKAWCSRFEPRRLRCGGWRARGAPSRTRTTTPSPARFLARRGPPVPSPRAARRRHRNRCRRRRCAR